MLNRNINFRDFIDTIDWDKIGDSRYHKDDEMLRELADIILYNVMPDTLQGQFDQLREINPELTVLNFYKGAESFGPMRDSKDGIKDSMYYGLLSDTERAESDKWSSDGSGVTAADYYQLYHRQGDIGSNPKRAKLVRMFQEIEKLL